MSYEKVIDLIRIFDQHNDDTSQEVGYIKFHNENNKMSFKEGITIIETKNHAYNVYLVCVRTENPDEELTDAEEEITMTQVVGVKSKNPSLTTVIPDSDDEADSDDSVSSVILSSQEDRKKSSCRSRQNTEENLSKQSHVSESLRLDLSEVSVHEAETQAVNYTNEVVSGSSSIHELDTQEIGFNNMYECFKPELTKRANVSSTKFGHKNQVGDHQSNEETTIITKDIKDEDMGEPQPNEIHDMETQLIFKIPEIPGGEKFATNVSIPNEDREVGDSQLCDFGDFTEEFEIPESQSLLVNMDQIPEPTLPPLDHKSVENNSDVNDAKIEEKDCIVSKDGSEEKSTKEENITAIDDELTQIIDINDVENIDLDIHEVATQMIPKLPHLVNDNLNDIYDMATQCIVKNEPDNIYDALTQCVTKKEDSDEDITDIEDNISSPPTKTDVKANIKDGDGASVEINDGLQPKTKEDNVEIIDDGNDVNMTQTLEDALPAAESEHGVFTSATQVCVNNFKCLVTDVYNEDTLVVFPESQTNVDGDTVGDVDVYKQATETASARENVGEILPSPICKPVILTSDNFSGETNLDQKLHRKISPPSDARAVISKETTEVRDNFVFSTPNSQLIKRKRKTKSVINDADITLTMKNIAPSLESSPSSIFCDKNAYNNTQELVLDLVGDDECATIEEKGKENNIVNIIQSKTQVPSETDECYNSTQDVLQELLQDECDLKTKNPLKNYYNSTQDILDDLLTQKEKQSPRKIHRNKSLTPTKTDSASIETNSQSSESSEDFILKSPQKKKKKFIITDSELDSPQIDSFVSKMLPPANIISTSDTEDNPVEDSEDIPVVFRAKVPCRKSKVNAVKSNINERFNNKGDQDADSKKTQSDTRESDKKNIPHTVGKKKAIETNQIKNEKSTEKDVEKKIDKKVKPNKKEAIQKNVSDRNQTANTDGDQTIDSKKSVKETGKTVKCRTKQEVVLERSCSSGSRESTSNINESAEVGTRRSTRKRKANQKYQDNSVNTSSNESLTGKKTRSCKDMAISATPTNDVRKHNKNHRDKALEVVAAEKKRVSNRAESKITPRGHLKVMVTSLECTPELIQSITSLGGSLVEKDGDVLVAPVPCKRTVKIMMAAALGIPIVTQQWVTKSKSNGSFLDPWSHLLKCAMLEAKYNVSLEKVLKSAKPHLRGCTVYITPSLVIPQNQLKELIEACGGEAEFVHKTTARRSVKTTKGKVMSVSCVDDEQLWAILPDPLLKLEALLLSSFTHHINTKDVYRQYKG